MTSTSPYSPRLINGIAALVAAVWTISFLADIFLSTYDPSAFIHLAMMAVVGATVGHTVITRGEK